MSSKSLRLTKLQFPYLQKKKKEKRWSQREVGEEEKEREGKREQSKIK